jgi:hypothetical protein
VVAAAVAAAAAADAVKTSRSAKKVPPMTERRENASQKTPSFFGIPN